MNSICFLEPHAALATCNLEGAVAVWRMGPATDPREDYHDAGTDDDTDYQGLNNKKLISYTTAQPTAEPGRTGSAGKGIRTLHLEEAGRKGGGSGVNDRASRGGGGAAAGCVIGAKYGLGRGMVNLGAVSHVTVVLASRHVHYYSIPLLLL